MRALLCHEFGGPDKLRLGEVVLPPAGPGELKIAIHACGLNFADTLIIQGLYQEKPPFPFSPGMEIAGEVIEIGEGVSDFLVGDRIAAMCGHGGFAEEVIVPAGMALRLPGNMDYVTGASFAVAYGTSHLALAHRAHLQPGETLLVHGAAGGVGLTAVELGKLMGATVIATASSAEKLALAQRYGADHLINYKEESFRERVLEITGKRGADVIYDPVGGPVFEESVRCVAWEGRLLVIGFASGAIAQFPTNLALVKNFSVVGLYWGRYAQKDPAVLLHSMRQLLDWYDDGKLQPHISQVLPLAQGGEALQILMDRQAQGKVVLQIR
ncbi:MAG: NADPH:quinone oxidoreductase family protein [Anaerolineales bacterium]|nr:NADPH:quinone oxidoreductase family protein [Anaerolineales bacterium]